MVLFHDSIPVICVPRGALRTPVSALRFQRVVWNKPYGQWKARMKKYANRMGLVFAVAGVCLTCCLISLFSGQKPGIETRPLATLADLRRELGYVQMLTLPIGGEPAVVEGGEYLFEPDLDDPESSLLLGALLPQESGGWRCWPVILMEDPASRDTVILDAEGDEVVRLPCEPDYDPGWAFDLLSPLPQGLIDAAAYDPAKVALSMRLISRRDGPAAADAVPVPDTKTGQPLAAKAVQKTAEANTKKAPEAKRGAQAAGPDLTDAAGCAASALPAPEGQVPAAAFTDVIDDTDGDGLSDDEELGMGKVVAWGQNTYAQGLVPATVSNVIAVAAGYTHNLALRVDGSVAAWGQNTYAQCTVPASASNVVSIAAGAYHSLARRADGTVLAWGRNTYKQCTVPALASNAVALTAGMYHSAALRPTGTVVAWGQNTQAQCTVPATATNVVALSSGYYHNLALRGNGSVVAWGYNGYGQCTVPAAATNVIAVAAGGYHSLALRADGSVIAWGYNGYQQCTVPTNATQTVALGTGQYFSFAIRADGCMVAWGQNTAAQCTGATNVLCARSVKGGANHALALRGPNPFKADTDNDAMTDGWEVVHGFDPLNGKDGRQDADADGLSNLAEFTHKTDPRKPDTDGDGMSDGWELSYGFNPLTPEDTRLDADGDGVSDGDECRKGTNPKCTDTDGDTMPDGWEIGHGLDPLNPADGGQDADGDGLTNLGEFTGRSDPSNADTDGDTMPDGWELAYGLNVLNPEDAMLDMDKDGILNRRECEMGSDPSAGCFLKETFDNGIPPDWMHSTLFYSLDSTGSEWIAHWKATPADAAKWMASWGSAGCNLPQLPRPYGNKGLNVGISSLGLGSDPYGASSLMTPWMNLGKGMTNVVLSFYFCNPSLYTYQTNVNGDPLGIYCRSRTRNAAGVEVIDVQPVVTLGEYPVMAAQYWKQVSVRLPNPSEDCQVVFVYYSTGPHIGVYVDEVTIAGDYGRVSQETLPLSLATASALPSASRGIPYKTPLSVRGGLRPFLWRYQWSVVSNALPQGLELDMNTGVISGTPVTLGPCSFSIEAKSEYGKAATNRFTLLIREPAVALDENFDSGWLPQGWRLEGQNPGSYWSAASGISPDGIAGLNAWYKGDATAAPQLISPVMDLSRCTSNVVLKFWYRNPKGTYTGNRDYLLVYALDGQVQTCLAASAVIHSGSPGVQSMPDADDWRQAVLFLPRLSAATRIAFGGYTGSTAPSPVLGGGVFLDHIEVLADYGDPSFLAWMTLHFPDGAVSGFYEDPDSDELANLQEYLKGTDPHDSDTDEDDLTDGDEVAGGTDPTDDDTDNDGLTDGAEVLIHHTDPLKPDTDSDGLPDGDELLHGSDPVKTDTDNDGMPDGWEVKHNYPPLIWNDRNLDTDNDGLTDGEESQAGTDPRLIDSDHDSLSDLLEVRYGFNPIQWGVYADSDKDGLPDKLEQAIGTDPNNRDSDGDSLADGWEFNNGLDPLNAAGDDGQQGDPDNDGLSNFEEYINETSPKNPDTDGDNTPDGPEVSQGSAPSDSSDNGQPPPASEIVEVPFSIGGDYASWEMTIQGLGPVDKRTLKLSTDAPGDSKTKNLKLRKGNSYRITMKWLRSKYSYPSWYCWEAQVGSLPQMQTFDSYTNVRKANVAVSLFGEGWYVDNSDGLLSTHTHMNDDQGGNVIGNLSATLYVLKIDMAMDGNRDGVIEFDKDEDRQAIFWVNNDSDVKHYNEDMWQEDDLNECTPNCEDDTIGNGVSIPGENPDDAHYTEDNCLRDLEDFARLHIRIKAPAGMPTDGVTCTLRFQKVNETETTPKAKVFKALKAGQEYLQIKSDAEDQVKEKSMTPIAVNGACAVNININNIHFNGETSPFLFEGCTEGIGDLTIVLKMAGEEIAKTSVRICLRDISWFCNVYQTTIDFSAGEWSPRPSDNYSQNRVAAYRPETDDEYLLVHGWNMAVWEKRRWIETTFKRLWWQGYKGRVSSFEWPTLDSFDSISDAVIQLRHFDNSEYRAWLSAKSLSKLIKELNTNGKLRIMAHSMGNIVAGESLRLLQSSIPQVHTYIACQAALSAQYYGDEKGYNPCGYQSLDISFPGTPDVMGKFSVRWDNNVQITGPYFFENNNSVANFRNWYNAVDWALDHWEKNNVFKPDNFGWGYRFGYSGVVYGLYTENLDRFYRDENTLRLTQETERFMIFSHAAESRSRALGQIPKNGFENWDLKADMHYDSRHYSHSREFRSNVVDEWDFWNKVVDACGFNSN